MNIELWIMKEKLPILLCTTNNLDKVDLLWNALFIVYPSYKLWTIHIYENGRRVNYTRNIKPEEVEELLNV